MYQDTIHIIHLLALVVLYVPQWIHGLSDVNIIIIKNLKLI